MWDVAEMPVSTRVAALVALGLLVTTGLAGARPPAHEPSAAPMSRQPLAADAFQSARTYPIVAYPVRLRVPVLGVDSALQQLDRLPDGSVGVPDRPDVAGWYVGGPRPGQPGPAVILGHVDSRDGPGVFLKIARLTAGAVIHVDRADGSTASFHVIAVARVPKANFPTDLVYAPTLQPTLRLVTCGGSFDHARRSYRDNVIVFAAQA
jgi:hypothetical protein